MLGQDIAETIGAALGGSDVESLGEYTEKA